MTERSVNNVWRQGRVWMPVVAAITVLAGWFVYDAMVAPPWMRDFGLELAARSTIVSDRSKETAFSTMRGRPEPDSPYICMTQVAPFEWDRVHFVPSRGPVPLEISELKWKGEQVSDLNARLASDSRYQLIAFVKGDEVIEHGYYFTMWADLSALGHARGFERSNAVFTAESNGDTYTVVPAVNSAQQLCTE